MIEISFKNIKKIYPGEKIALDDLNLEIKKGEFLTVIGPSGCGKTTLLKMINGLVMPTQGELLIHGKNIKDIDIIALRRKIGYVIQQIGLFPHLNIEKNISYVLKIMGVEEDKRRKRAEELLSLVGLEKETLEMYPRELSGGQQQRIGVIRALAADPPIILMDEPFGAIDEITRKTLQDELLKLQERLKKTIVFITHDIEEAMKLGDRIALINKGKLEQIASSKEMFLILELLL
ncbi:ABC transporter ATP-binding protein [Tissierella creatinophila]|uniref:ABC-type quaternary amine transporter n=1 Tax=Tissierella creatinophila DSM 6911 TaxID=1123403 RepID=A0A1U7M4U5_TISCR|nr:ATP-binding cassette domain-containing protein [Tissierella creatinophila]OLS02344.1 choline transport ATP-binding protein OpuBA [Tissierella creatinophila DSM 6911]